MYGVADGPGQQFATNCLLARRMVERGVRFVMLTHASWDDHTDLNRKLKKNCDIADKPTADTFWQQSTGSGQVIVRGTHLLRGATLGSDGTLNLSGDNADNPNIEVFTAASAVTSPANASGPAGGSGNIGATLNLPVYLEAEVQSRLTRLANAKGVDFSALVNALLRKDIELIEMAK